MLILRKNNHMETIMKDKICKLLGISTASYYRWKEERPIINLLEKYFKDDDLKEFLETGKISKLESKTLDDHFKQLILEDHMLHNAAHKLHLLSSGSFKMIDILKDALSDIDPDDNTFTLDNAKQRLIDRIFAIEKNSIFKTNAKKEGVASWIEKYLSKAEVFAMVKKPTAFIKLLK